LRDLLLAEVTQHPGHGFARGAHQLRDLFMGKGYLDANPIFRVLALL
jgi:hypothetical protein